MSPKTAKALEESIAHWKRMRDDPDCGERTRGDDCALCSLFVMYNCEGCPVKVRTEQSGCRGTPWSVANAAFFTRHEDPHLWHTAATEEIEFLESLREPEVKPLSHG